MGSTRQKGRDKARQKAIGRVEGSVADSDDKSQRRAVSQIIVLGVLLVVIGAAVLMAHWPALSCQAISFDDEHYLLENQLVQNPSWTSARQFFTEVLEPSTVKGYYQPLTMLSLMLDYAMGGRPDNLLPFHRTSLALHIINTMLVAVFVYLLFGQVLAAAAVGLLFGVHPLTIESIPWVAERKTLLAAFLVLWSLIFYLRHTKRGGWKYYTISAVMYVLALMAKPTSIPLPFLMLLLDYWPLRRLSRKVVLEKIPFFAIGAVFGIVIFISQSATFGVRMPGEFGLGRIVLILCHNIVLYLSNMAWPANLSLFYPFPQPMALSQPKVLAGVLGTVVLMPALLISLRRTRAALTGWLFFFVAILPTMGVIGFHDMIAADRHAYLPFVGILLPLAYFLCWLWDNAASVSARTVRQIATLVLVVILASLEGLATRQYLVYWKDTVTLRRRMVALAPQEPIVHNSLALALSDEGKFDKAVIHYNEALRFKSNIVSTIHYNLADTLRQLGRFNEAVMHYNEAIYINPGHADAYNNLALMLIGLGRFDEAIAHCTEAIRLKPDQAEAHYNRAIALAKQGSFDEAVADFTEAIRLKPTHTGAYNNLAIMLSKQGKLDEAIEQFRRALRIQPFNADIHCNLGILLARRGRTDEAVREYLAALKIAPDHKKASENLQAILKKQHD